MLIIFYFLKLSKRNRYYNGPLTEFLSMITAGFLMTLQHNEIAPKQAKWIGRFSPCTVSRATVKEGGSSIKGWMHLGPMTCRFSP